MTTLNQASTPSEITELRKLRLSYGISSRELCEEIGLARGLYLVHEKGTRKYKGDRYEEFYHTVATALARLHKQRVEAAQLLNHTNAGLNWKNEDERKILSAQIAEEELEDEFDVQYPPITESLFKNALTMLTQGFNLVQIAVRLGICENELENRIGTMSSKIDLSLAMD